MADNIKISALTELVSGSIVGTTIIPTVEGGVTLKVQMSSIKAFTNSDVATDTELANSISTVNNTISGLDTDDITEGTAQYYTDAKVKTKLNADGVLSGSFPSTFNLGVIGGGTSVSNVDSITISGGTVTDNGGGDIDISIDSGSLTLINGGTNIQSVNTININGGTLTDNGSGDVTIGLGSLSVEDIAGGTVTDVTKVNFSGITSLSDDGSGEVTVTIPTAVATDLSQLNTFTGSIDGRVTTLETADSSTDISLLNVFTGSIDERVNTLEGAASSDISQLNAFTGSFSSSIESRITLVENGGSDDGTISGSQQISDLGFTSSSLEVLQGGSSIETNVQSINFNGAGVSTSNGVVTITTAAGGGSGDVEYDNDFNIISQSIAAPENINLTLSQIKIGTGINDFKFIDFSESLDSRFGSGGGSDYISNVTYAANTLTFTGENSAFSGNVELSSGIISSSVQINSLGFLTSLEISDNLPVGTISGSQQITEAGFATTASVDGFASIDNISGSFVEEAARLDARIEGNSIFTGSIDGRVEQLESASINTINTSLNTFTGSIDGRVTTLEDVDLSHIIQLNEFTGSIDGRATLLESEVLLLNTFTASFSSSMEGRVTTLESAGDGGGTQLEIKSNFSVISQSYDFGETNLKLEAIEIGGDSGNFTFKQVSQSLDDRINAVTEVSELSGLSDVGTITVDVAEGDILVYDSVAQEFTHSQDLTGNYKITGSIDTKGSINVSGSVTADSFIAGDVGTPIINAATLLEINAGNSVSITAGAGGLILSSSADVRVNTMLTIEKTIGNPSASPLTGSMMNSGSIDSDSKLWFYNGTVWKEISFV